MRYLRVSVAALVLSIVSVVALNATFTALCGGGASCAYIAGDKFGYQTVELIRQNFNHLVAPQYWTGAADAGLTGEKNLGALSTGLVINTAGVPSAYAGATCAAGTVATATGASGALTCGITPTTASTTDTFTNKTLNAESTGNLVTLPIKHYWVAAICQNATAISGWSMPVSNSAVATCATGTNTQIGTLDFADGALSLSVQQVVRLPLDWTGAIDVVITWFSSATSGNVVWQVATICVADAETGDPAFNTASTVTDAVKGTTLQMNDATLTGITATGCAAGETLHIKVFRDPANASDTLAATASLVGVELTLRRGM